MQVEYNQSGIYFRLESDDFKYGATREFLAAVKKIDGWSYEPPEKPIGAHWWRIPAGEIALFKKAKKIYIDDPVQCEKELRNPSNPALKDLAYKPIPTVNRKFCKKRVV